MVHISHFFTFFIFTKFIKDGNVQVDEKSLKKRHIKTIIFVLSFLTSKVFVL